MSANHEGITCCPYFSPKGLTDRLLKDFSPLQLKTSNPLEAVWRKAKLLQKL